MISYVFNTPRVTQEGFTVPKLVLPLSNSYKSVQRNIQYSVQGHLLDLMQLPKDSKLLDLPEETHDQQTGSSMDVQDSRSGDYSIAVGNRLRMEYVTELVEPEGLTNTVFGRNNTRIFHDKALDVWMQPVYQKVKTTANVTIRFQSQNQASEWYNNFMVKFNLGLQQVTHSANYHYPLPVAAVLILEEIFRLREQQAGYGEYIEQWFTRHSIKELDTIMDVNGGNRTMVIKNTQHEMLGDFNFRDSLPRPTPKDASGVYEVNFSYSVNYEQPTAIAMNYPIVIHNQLMPTGFLDTTREYDFDELFNKFGSIGQYGLYDNRVQTGNYYTQLQAYPGLSIPSFDQWSPKYLPNGDIMLARISVMLDPNDLTLLMDLNDLKEYGFREEVLTFLKDPNQSPITPLQGPIRIYLYRNSIPLEHAYLELDEDLVLRSTQPLNLREFYHVVITVTNRWDVLDSRSYKALCKNGDLTAKMIATLLGPQDPNLIPRVREDGTIRRMDLDAPIRAITERMPGRYGPGPLSFFLVALFTVDGDKR